MECSKRIVLTSSGTLLQSSGAPSGPWEPVEAFSRTEPEDGSILFHIPFDLKKAHQYFRVVDPSFDDSPMADENVPMDPD